MDDARIEEIMVAVETRLAERLAQIEDSTRQLVTEAILETLTAMEQPVSGR